MHRLNASAHTARLGTFALSGTDSASNGTKKREMTLNFYAITDTGRCRKNNEDSVAYDGQRGVAVLADGMGGYNAGEVASSMATQQILGELTSWLQSAGARAIPNDIQRAMERTAHHTNQAIYRAARIHDQYAGMGTTLVMGVFHNDRAQIGHIGDSRCYRSRAGILEQITRDHSLIQEQIDAGLVTPEQAQFSNIKNLVTRALGVQSVSRLEINDFSVLGGDIFLLCSDGLSDMVPWASIGQILASDLDLQQKAELLVATANGNGGRDNISVLLVEAQEHA